MHGFIIAAIAIFMVALGTQQTALGGLMAAGLPTESYPKATSVQGVAAGLAGFVLGAAVLYVLADWGWRAVIAALSFLSLMGCVAAIWAAPSADVPKDAGLPRVPFLSHLSVFKSPKVRVMFAISVLVNACVGLPFGAKAEFFIDAGISVSDSALYGIVLGNLLGMLGACLARPVTERMGGLPVLAWLAAFNVSVVLPMAILACLSTDGLGPFGTTALVLLASFSVFASFIATRSVVMGLCQPGRQATEMASFVGLEAVAFLVVAGISVSVLEQIGLGPILLALIPGSLIGGCLAWRNRNAFA